MKFDAADEALTRGRSDLEVVFADKLPARLIGSSVGLIVGGPGGALAGASAAPLVEYLLNKGNQRYVANAQRMLVGAADLAGHTVGELWAYVEDSPDRGAAAVSAVQAAADTLYEAKVTALARVLAYGLVDDARLEIAAVYLRALRDLEAYHVRVLAHLDARRRAVNTDREALMESEDLEAEMPGLADGMAPILAVLEREALAYSGLVDGGGPEDEGTLAIGSYVITPFGQRVLVAFIVRGVVSLNPQLDDRRRLTARCPAGERRLEPSFRMGPSTGQALRDHAAVFGAIGESRKRIVCGQSPGDGSRV